MYVSAGLRIRLYVERCKGRMTFHEGLEAPLQNQKCHSGNSCYNGFRRGEKSVGMQKTQAIILKYKNISTKTSPCLSKRKLF